MTKRKDNSIILTINTKSIHKKLKVAEWRMKTAIPFLWVASKIMDQVITVEYEIKQQN